jgi:hypothetical protein
MVHNLTPTIEWISQCIETERENEASLSLWRALYDYGQLEAAPKHNLPPLPEGAAPAVVYVTGDFSLLNSQSSLFHGIEKGDDLVYFTYGEGAELYAQKRKEPVLRFLSVCYIPPQMLGSYQGQVDRMTVLTQGKLEVWMRPLFIQKKVSGLVGYEKSVDPRWGVSWSSSYERFSYSLLLQDQIPKDSPTTEIDKQRPEIPIGLRLGLQRAIVEEYDKRNVLWNQVLDRIVMQLFDEDWLIHAYSIPEYIPILLEEVGYYVEQIRSIPAEEKYIDRVASHLELWWTKGEYVYAL